MNTIPKSTLALGLLLVSLLTLLLALHLSRAPEGSEVVRTAVAHQIIAEMLHLFGGTETGTGPSLQRPLPVLDLLLTIGSALIGLLFSFSLLGHLQQRSRSRRS